LIEKALHLVGSTSEIYWRRTDRWTAKGEKVDHQEEGKKKAIGE
jgi:hypothetical protein